MTTITPEKTRTPVKMLSGSMLCDAIAPHFPICSVSQGYCELTGYSPEEVVGQAYLFMQGENSNSEITQTIRQALVQGGSF